MSFTEQVQECLGGRAGPPVRRGRDAQVPAQFVVRDLQGVQARPTVDEEMAEKADA